MHTHNRKCSDMCSTCK